MRILILGGTTFVGPVLISEATSRGHDVTILNRGNKPAPDSVTQLIGDRLQTDGGLAALKGLHFDAVIDTWASDPAAVRNAVAALRGNIGFYVYVSSISVYDDASAPGSTSIIEGVTQLVDLETSTFKYGKDKLAGELAAQDSGVPALILRAGLIIGPHEWYPGRLPWWLDRMRRGGPTLAPLPRELSLQFIDVRDLARFTLDAIEKKRAGVFNVVSPPGHVTMGDFLETMSEVTGGHAELQWVDPGTIIAAGIAPWTELPFWLGPDDATSLIYKADVSRALEAGLHIRPARETIADTWKWMEGTTERQPGHPSIGLEPAKEAVALVAGGEETPQK